MQIAFLIIGLSIMFKKYKGGRKMKIGLLGCGTVGSGVFEVINSQREIFNRLYGGDVEIKKILVRDKGKPREAADIYPLLTTEAYEILDDPSIDLVVEVLGGVEEAYEYISYGLKKGKHVVTANKAVVAKHMEELLDLAEKNKRAFLFEGSVGGGIPLLKPLKQCSLLNEFSEVKGILNGTSNFILSKMMEENLDFQEALELARKMGYAEADPSDDIEGADVGRKLAILASIVFKEIVSLESITYRGINGITKADVDAIKNMGYVVKLLGKAVSKNKGFAALVEPVLFKNTSIYERVNDVFNMVSVKGDNLAELSFYGEGAGKKATANAVVCDIIDVLDGGYQRDIVCNNKKLEASGKGLIDGSYYIRVTLKDSSEYYSVKNILRNKDISFTKGIEDNNVFLLTENVASETINEIIQEFEYNRYTFFLGRLEAE